MKYNILHVIKDLITGNIRLAPSSVIKQRRRICNSCEVQNKKIKVCTACGCYIPLKTRMAPSECPLELWSAVDPK